MSKISQRAGATKGSRKNPPRKPSRLGAVVLFAALVVVAAICYRSMSSSSQSKALAEPTNQTPPITATTPMPVPAPITDPQQLITNLTAVDGKEPIADQAQKWKESLQQLIHLGPTSVQPIQKFLSQNLDANYAGVSGADQLGYNSLRSALFDALVQIGGPESTAAMLQTLQTSIFPTDVSSVAKVLEAQSPGQFQQDILNAVRQQLSLAAMDQLGGANVGPLFQVLSNMGAAGASVEGDIAQYAEKWSYYSIIALIGLPNNAGVPAIIQIAQGTLAGNQTVAGQALAELAPDNPEALSALIALAKNNQINDSALSQLAPFLGGRQYQLTQPSNPAAPGFLTLHMGLGNQDFASRDDTALTPAQLTHRISIIDQVLAVIPPADVTAQDAIQQQKTALAARLPSH